MNFINDGSVDGVIIITSEYATKYLIPEISVPTVFL